MAIPELWLAILVSAVGVWIASAVVWMVLPFHKSDFKGLPDEEAGRAALKRLAPGQYNIPHMASQKEMATPEGKAKCEEGPIVLMTVMPNGVPNMGKSLGIWFVFNLLVGVLVAYVTTRTLPAGAEYLSVFRVAGTVAWIAYGLAGVQESIWFGRPWGTTFKHLLDALVYGLFTAGVFGWLWPG